MAKLLYIECSPRGERSASSAIAREFIACYRATHPDDEVETINLWSGWLPELDGDMLSAKYRIIHGETHTPEEARAWSRISDICDHFKSAGRYLLSLPMWNFGIPYKLKHYIDIITQPGLTFSPDGGHSGLVTGRPVVVIYSRGGDYSASSQAQAHDFQRPYLEFLLRFIGFEDIRPIVMDGLHLGPVRSAAVRESTSKLAREIASNL